MAKTCWCAERGVGKTAFILSTLHRLQRESKKERQSTRSAHIRDFRGGHAADLYAVVLRGLEQATEEPLPYWLRRWMPQEVAIKTVVIEAKWKTDQVEAAILDRIEWLFDRAKRRRNRLIIAIDDLDKSDIEQGGISTMLTDC